MNICTLDKIQATQIIFHLGPTSIGAMVGTIVATIVVRFVL